MAKRNRSSLGDTDQQKRQTTQREHANTKQRQIEDRARRGLLSINKAGQAQQEASDESQRKTTVS